MSATKDSDLEIEDDLARGSQSNRSTSEWSADGDYSAEIAKRLQSQDIQPVEKELCPRERCEVSGF